MSTLNIGFYEEISKIITSLSSNTHLISSAVYNLVVYWVVNPPDTYKVSCTKVHHFDSVL